MSKRELIESHKGDKRYARRVGTRRRARAIAATGSVLSRLGPRRIHQVFSYILERGVPKQTVARSAAELGIDQDSEFETRRTFASLP